MKKILLIFLITVSLTACSKQQDWGYSEENGPETWAEVNDEYATCADGDMQSPIDIDSSEVSTTTNTVDLSYSKTNFKLIDTGHSLEFEVEGEKPTLQYDSTTYQLDQIHFHNESENTIDSKHYPLEAHFVNHELNNEDNKLVLSVMFDLGSYNEIIGDKFERINEEVSFDPSKLIPEQASHYEFSGSLTTPPCSEGVKWIVFETPLSIGQDQLDAFTAYYSNNNRPTQDLNGRNIHYVK